MSIPAHLSPDEIVPERPFSDPQHSFEDLRIMRHMARQLIDTYDDPKVCDFTPGGRPVCQSDKQGRHFRIYYIQPGLLFERFNITVVGFFGQRRDHADIGPIIEADKQFEKEFHAHPGLLSLSTVRLPDGDFGNLVLFTSAEAKDKWNFSPLHHDLAARVSPPYYRSVRLNNGILPRGLGAPEELYLQRTRYIDYEIEPPWRAVREY
ncbi:MAG: hypothetical protein ACK2U5_01570 [Candidatus Promineifilaceae bacterium]|jgi:hypothetical protein